MKKKIRIFALLLVVAMLLSAFAYAHEETDSAKIHLTGETLSEADDVQAIGNRAIFISTQNKIASVDDSQQEYVAEYVPEYQIEFAIPYQNKGVMIGSEKPTMVACPNALCKDEYVCPSKYGVRFEEGSGLYQLRATVKAPLPFAISNIWHNLPLQPEGALLYVACPPGTEQWQEAIAATQVAIVTQMEPEGLRE